jgi:hypothetical protein
MKMIAMKSGRAALVALMVGVVLAQAGVATELKLAPPADGADAVPVLLEALTKCKVEGIQRLALQPGVWNLYPEKAVGMHRHVSNHDPGYRRVAIHLDGFSNFELDGQDATLLCHGVLTPIAADRSQNVAIRNLTIAWDKPFQLEGTVREVGADWFEVEFLPECEVVLRDGKLYGGVAELYYGELMSGGQARQDFQWNYWIDPATKAAAAIQPPWLKHWNPKTKSFAEITELQPNRFRIRNAHTVLPAKGSIMVCKGMNRQNRLAPAIHLSSVERPTVENVTVHHAGGMGVIAEDCTNPTVRNFRVALKSDARSLVTTTADATHFVGCYGTVRVEDCLFENMLDDSCNVHGVYAIAEGLLAPARLAISFSHFEQLGTAFARPGDRLRLIKRDTLLGYAECAVKAIERRNEDYYVLTLDRPMADLYQTNSSVENLSARPDVIYRHNTVRNNRARSMLVTAGGKVLIESNRFERPSALGILIEGDNHFWFESGGVEDVTIRNNLFIGQNPASSMFRIAPMQPGETRLLPPYHRNIHIVDNVIRSASPLIVEANRVGGLEFSGNKVEFTAPPKNTATPAFKLSACEGVVLRNNTFNRPAKLQTQPMDAAVVLENNGALTCAPAGSARR